MKMRVREMGQKDYDQDHVPLAAAFWASLPLFFLIDLSQQLMSKATWYLSRIAQSLFTTSSPMTMEAGSGNCSSGYSSRKAFLRSAWMFTSRSLNATGECGQFLLLNKWTSNHTREVFRSLPASLFVVIVIPFLDLQHLSLSLPARLQVLHDFGAWSEGAVHLVCIATILKGK